MQYVCTYACMQGEVEVRARIGNERCDIKNMAAKAMQGRKGVENAGV